MIQDSTHGFYVNPSHEQVTAGYLIIVPIPGLASYIINIIISLDPYYIESIIIYVVPYYYLLVPLLVCF